MPFEISSNVNVLMNGLPFTNTEGVSVLIIPLHQLRVAGIGERRKGRLVRHGEAPVFEPQLGLPIGEEARRDGRTAGPGVFRQRKVAMHERHFGARAGPDVSAWR